VLSTLHTNDACSAITRLLELGIAPYLLKASLIGVMAQRLVRTLCDHCKAAPTAPMHSHQAVGCGECRQTGYHGRSAIFELLGISDALKARIEPDLDLLALRRLALDEGMLSLKHSGAEKVAAGQTTEAEVLRVIA